MSRFGKQPLLIKPGVTVKIEENKITVSGSRGSLTYTHPKNVEVVQKENELTVNLLSTSKQARADQGTTKSHINNMMIGVTDGWTRELEIQGTGFRSEVRGSDLILTVGYSHPVTIKAPEGVTFTTEKMIVKVTGIDKGIVTQTAVNIKRVRVPDAYQGKGIKYKDEVLKLKPGKQAAKAA